MADKGALEAMLEGLLEKVRAMPPGGDLEGLLEEETAKLKTGVYEAAIAERGKTAEEADFPPSGLRGVQARDAADQGSKAKAARLGRRGRL